MKSVDTVLSAIHSALALFYPHPCAGCGKELPSHSQTICLYCRARLPETQYASFADNPVEKIFWGRMEVKAAASQYYFSRSSVIQSIIHQLKYKGNREVGLDMGRLMGTTLKQSGRFSNIDGIIPLPLFPEKEWRRGYNQAEVIAIGAGEILSIPILKDAVVRKKYTETQTHKTRMERWQNVKEVFSVSDPAKVRGKNLLLVDDVITTGATLEACGMEILDAGATGLYISALAYAVQ